MRHLGLATIVLIASGLAASADVQVATSRDVPSGTYRGPGYVTNFVDGTWTTNGQGGVRINGRYSVDDNVITFTSAQGGCPQERTRYRLTPTQNGFHLKFIEDTCQHAGQDIEFVRAR